VYRYHLVPFILFLGALSATGQNIITVTGTSAGVDNENATAQSSWTQTTTYTGVTIQATLDSCGGTVTGTAYLTLNGTAVGNQIAVNNAASVNPGAGGGDGTVTLFSGLTLGPGTYYLTINPTNTGECDELWQNIQGTPAVTTGTGVTAGSSGATGAGHGAAAYPPQSAFLNSASFLFSVTGTAATGGTPPATPAPPTVILLGVALLLTLWYIRL
jgi:hypothetical protein